MFEQLIETNIFIYAMLGLCALGVVIKLTLKMVYQSLMKTSKRMGAIKNKQIKNMKNTMETYHNLQVDVNNVDTFVDKCLYNYKFCGILLSTWENICGQLLLGCVLIGSITTVLAIVYECGRNDILELFTVGITTSGLLIFLESTSNLSDKKERIRLNIIHYFENVLKVSLEHGELTKERLSELSIDVNEFEITGELKAQEIKTERSKLRVVREGKVKSHNFITPTIKENRKERRKKLKQANKRIKLQEKLLKKQEKQVEKYKIKREKEELLLQKRSEKEELLQQKRAEKERHKHSKITKREERERELDRLREQEREQQRILEVRRHEDKRMEEELKRVLLLEKAYNKNKKSDLKTPAIEIKESLLKESRERRLQDEDSIKNIIEVVPLGEAVSESLEEAKSEVASTIHKERTTAARQDGNMSIDPRKREHIRNMIDLRMKQGNHTSENLLDDILNELFH